MLTIEYDNFCRRLADSLDESEIDVREKRLMDIPGFDSMGLITTALLIEELFAFQIKFDILRGQESAKSLYEYCIEATK